jgi:hypothetical protein
MKMWDTLGGSVSVLAAATEAAIEVVLLPLKQIDLLMTSRSIEKARTEIASRNKRKEMLAALDASWDQSNLERIA